ncbi:ABC transporter permease [Massilia niastensis]|uniref:ABC transporter permease n=1 Tax=Massilia niastensis TaxID=544911 RepID=UPI0003700F17|nr:ABC transporter permease [Massilia niastensis]
MAHPSPARPPAPLIYLREFVFLWRDCLAGAGLLRRPPYQRRFLQLFLDGAVKAAAGPGLRVAAVGALAIAAALDALSADTEAAVRLLVLALMRELGPLLAALIVLIRVGIPLTGDIGMMQERGELRALRLLGLPSREYVAVPALFALAALTVVLTLYLQLTVLGGGIVLGAALLGLSPAAAFGQATLLVTPGDLLYTLLKSAGFGLLIGSLCVHDGLKASADPAGMPDALARAAMQCLSLLLLLNLLLAFLLYRPLFASVARP